MMHFRPFILTVLAIALLGFPGTAAASSWFAAPGGSGSDCTEAAPCSADYATGTKAAEGDTVKLAGGDYVYTSGYLSVAKNISLEGAASGTPTRIIAEADSDSNYALEYSPATEFSGALRIANLTAINRSPATSYFPSGINIDQLAPTSVIDRVYGVATEAGGVGIWISPSIGADYRMTNSIGRAIGANGVGVEIKPAGWSGDANSKVTMVNVLGDGRGAGGVGIEVKTDTKSNNTCGGTLAEVWNSIARGATASLDFVSFTEQVCHGAIVTHNTNWRDASGNDGAAPTITGSPSDQRNVDPIFVDAAAGDYRAAPSSPTIDAGTVDPITTPLDFYGVARVLGAKPDIGPSEFLPPVKRVCFAKYKKTLKGGKGKKRYSLVVTGKPTADGSRIALKLKAKNARANFYVGKKKRRGKKLTVTSPSGVVVKYKVGRRTKQLKLKLKQPAC
jgi:hypothetical protein